MCVCVDSKIDVIGLLQLYVRTQRSDLAGSFVRHSDVWTCIFFLRKAILFLSSNAACWKETLDIASWLIYTVIVLGTDYRTSSLKSRWRYKQLSESAVLHFYTS